VKFTIIRSEKFREQFNALSLENKERVAKKVRRILQNNYNLKAFRARLKIQNKDARLIYVVREPDVILDAIVFRKHDYRDLKMHLKRLIEQEA